MNKKSTIILIMTTLAFFVCFACWVLYGVLVTFLVQNHLFSWDMAKMGWLIGIPILTGSIFRLPVGILADKYGGRIVFTSLMLISSGAIFSVSLVHSYSGFILAGLGLGLVGASFAAGVAYTAVWFEPARQGTALGIFGVGNLGAALTNMVAPSLLISLTGHGDHLENWRLFPQIFAGILVAMAILFFLYTFPKKVGQGKEKTLRDYLHSLKNPRVWRFGFYYFCLFGGFVSLAQWLVPYYVNAYGLSLRQAGMFAALFSFSCGVIRAFGGWISDHWGARRILYAILVLSLVCSFLLAIPSLQLQIFVPLVFLLGILMGIGMGAVYKHIPSYFPKEVGMVGGLVGMIGGLGGFFLPMIFGYLLQRTGLWTSCWILLVLLIGASLVWMHRVVRKMLKVSPSGFEVEGFHA